ncbi:MAG: hypothetical protein B0D92_01415 [Spirochaeta sp. LUC14_002_19_P3]|nr:MAG: hypothetical protein B0D92_01415 [Spirochaeta sp. LUC14_002_19_P3]
MRKPGERQYLTPSEIYRRSYAIIEENLGHIDGPADERLVRVRIAHASADTEFAKSFIFHPGAVEAGVSALKRGANIVTDVGMVEAGIRSRLPEAYGGKLSCFLYGDETAAAAKRDGTTKSAAALAGAIDVFRGGIVAIGNAPTALFELVDLVEEGRARPALVVGVPVGFVGAAESKRELARLDLPFITNPDRRGGSSLAAAIVNGLLHLAFE